MQFSVIYDFQIPKCCAIADYAPPHARKLWDLTEKDCDCETGFKQRKYGAVLNKKDFLEFLRARYFSSCINETMGMVGAPGFGFGWAPAFGLDLEDSAGWGSCYVCPIPEVKMKNAPNEKRQDRYWKMLRKALESTLQNLW